MHTMAELREHFDQDPSRIKSPEELEIGMVLEFHYLAMAHDIADVDIIGVLALGKRFAGEKSWQRNRQKLVEDPEYMVIARQDRPGAEIRVEELKMAIAGLFEYTGEGGADRQFLRRPEPPTQWLPKKDPSNELSELIEELVSNKAS